LKEREVELGSVTSEQHSDQSFDYEKTTAKEGKLEFQIHELKIALEENDYEFKDLLS
jgi:hypothetical protein